MPLDHEATIEVGMAKTKLLTKIYNWCISFLNEVINLPLATITAYFFFPRISTNVAGAIGFLAEAFYFVSTSHVFGSNTSASFWEAFQRAIQRLITILSQRDNLIEKHKDLLNVLRWVKENCTCPELIQAFPCEINSGVLDSNGNIILKTVNIYVNNIFDAAAFQDRMLKLLAPIVEAIFWSAELLISWSVSVLCCSRSGTN
jgi:hypothetical protein